MLKSANHIKDAVGKDSTGREGEVRFVGGAGGLEMSTRSASRKKGGEGETKGTRTQHGSSKGGLRQRGMMNIANGGLFYE